MKKNLLLILSIITLGLHLHGFAHPEIQESNEIVIKKSIITAAIKLIRKLYKNKKLKLVLAILYGKNSAESLYELYKEIAESETTQSIEKIITEVFEKHDLEKISEINPEALESIGVSSEDLETLHDEIYDLFQ